MFLFAMQKNSISASALTDRAHCRKYLQKMANTPETTSIYQIETYTPDMCKMSGAALSAHVTKVGKLLWQK